jgi:hypothetical protein
MAEKAVTAGPASKREVRADRLGERRNRHRGEQEAEVGQPQTDLVGPCVHLQEQLLVLLVLPVCPDHRLELTPAVREQVYGDVVSMLHPPFELKH